MYTYLNAYGLHASVVHIYFQFWSVFSLVNSTKSRIIQRAVITGYNPWFRDSIKK